MCVCVCVCACVCGVCVLCAVCVCVCVCVRVCVLCACVCVCERVTPFSHMHARKKRHTTSLTIAPLSLTVGLDPGARFSLGWLSGGGRDIPIG